ncbi:hypothetical protein [Streptomyces thermolineatus]|uniref:hypothetical protein n=1 Tax=Streptomyces thermolineatus TaxID=44033 RepID=UPI0031D753F2
MDTITDEIANHVLAHFGHGGYHAGSFTTHLLSALCAADPENFTRLAEAFPGYAAAVHLAQNEPKGIATLRVLATGAAA